ncbi:hypothetical protein COCOBI_14-4440 [Coccomyxa sp. Obi]|nr:hypothetical protein COCOBI_14-4440 [Coccomyxa sp. Obi]
MGDDEALQILTDYVKGCGGVLCAGLRAKACWEPNGARYNLIISSTPPKNFKPASGQQRKEMYRHLKHVAVAMGLKPNRHLAEIVKAPARAKCNSVVMGAKTSSLGPQDTDIRSKTPTPLDAGQVDGFEAASGPAKSSNHEGNQDWALPRHVPRPYMEGVAPSGQTPLPKKGPVQMPHEQPSMPSSRSTSSREVLPTVDINTFPEQPEWAEAGQPTLAAKTGKSGSEQPILAPASGTQQSPGGRQCDEEMERLRHEIRELKQQNATLELSLKQQQSQQGAREEEMRALTQTVNHLFSEMEKKR